MTQLTHTLNALWMSAMLLCTFPINGMEKPCDEQEQWKQSALTIEEYNDHICLLTILPKETLIEIFSHCFVEEELDWIESRYEYNARSLRNNIKDFMKLSTTCKSFNSVLTFDTIGNLCKNYHKNGTCKKHDQNVKSNALWDLIPSIDYTNYETKRLPTLILISASNEYNVDILWTLLENKYPSELMELFLTYNAHARKLRHWDNSCVFHILAQPAYFNGKNNIDDFLRKGKLLLNIIPDMINTLNKDGKTPLDVAQESLEKAHENLITLKEISLLIRQWLEEEPIDIAQESLEESQECDVDIKVFEQLILLFKEHSGLTAQELAQHAVTLKQIDQ